MKTFKDQIEDQKIINRIALNIIEVIPENERYDVIVRALLDVLNMIIKEWMKDE